jgi:hypothetical protein
MATATAHTITRRNALQIDGGLHGELLRWGNGVGPLTDMNHAQRVAAAARSRGQADAAPAAGWPARLSADVVNTCYRSSRFCTGQIHAMCTAGLSRGQRGDPSTPSARPSARLITTLL